MAGWRVGIDTGGTFTDIVAFGKGGETRTGKVSSTPPNFDQGVFDALDAVGVRPDEIGLLAHGTTATTNAIITKVGAKTGLVTTAGFRDVLELRRHNSEDLYDILWDPPDPLVPRRRRLEITERVNYAGEVTAPLAESELKEIVERLKEEGVESLAICLLHSYANPVHELRLKHLLAELWPDVYVSISSDLLREPGEFERTSTTVVNAYLGPILSQYVTRLQSRLRKAEFGGRLMIMHSGGGLLTAEAALAVPARTVTSGPAAGAMAAESFTTDSSAMEVSETPELSTGTQVKQLISLDMGGTSADIAVIGDGHALLVNEYSPEFGSPIRFPAVDLLAIGAGGGSIAWVDAAGSPQVGPQSAGARPGPACYGRGGSLPTVTDANLILGRLSPKTQLASNLELHIEPAVSAVSLFAESVGLPVNEASLGIIRIANSNMAKAVRVMTVERGLDPREFVLLPFGGAGPMHACELAAMLSIRHVLVPRTPGVFSAFGTLCVDLLHDYSRSLIKSVGELMPADIQTLFEELEAEATTALDKDQVPRDSQRLERSLDLRYGGQLKTLGIPLAGDVVDADTLASACERFYVEYERRYHYVTRDIGLELSVVRVRGRGLQQGPPPRPEVATSAPSPLETRPVLFEGAESFVPTAVFDRADLGSGVQLRGPLLVEQEDSTVIVPAHWSVTVDGDANLHLTHLTGDLVRREQA